MLSAFFLRQGPSLCEKRQGEKKHNGRRGRKKKKRKNLPCLLSDSEAERTRFFWGFFLKKLSADFQKDLSTKTENQSAGNRLRGEGVGGRSFTVIHFLNRIPSSDVPLPFCRRLHTKLTEARFEKKKYIYIYMSFLGRG